MKKFVTKIQGIGQKAAQFKHLVESAPSRAAELRESLLMTAGQLQQIRSDVQMASAGLKVDNADRLTQALQEIHDGADTFREAGYGLLAVDMEVAPIQRLLVHLEKLETVSESTLRGLLSANASRQTIYALLSAMAKADALTENVILSHLTYRELVVHVGPTPSVRICWHTKESLEEEGQTMATEEPSATAAQHPATAPASAGPRTVPPPLSAFTQSTYFEPRPAAPPASPPTVVAASAIPDAPVLPTSPSYGSTLTAPVSPAVPEAPAGGDWKRSALDRFKKMPDVSKYRR